MYRAGAWRVGGYFGERGASKRLHALHVTLQTPPGAAGITGIGLRPGDKQPSSGDPFEVLGAEAYVAAVKQIGEAAAAADLSDAAVAAAVDRGEQPASLQAPSAPVAHDVAGVQMQDEQLVQEQGPLAPQQMQHAEPPSVLTQQSSMVGFLSSAELHHNQQNTSHGSFV